MANISTGLPFEWDEDGTVDNNDEDEDDKNESDDKDAFGEDEEKDAFEEDEEIVHETWIKSRMSVKERIRNCCDISSFLLLPLFGDIEIGYTLVFGTVVGPVDTISTSLDASFRSLSAIL